MKVILTKTVPKVGKEGDVLVVADGFARNYLFPRSLAIFAERKQIAAMQKRADRIEAKTADQKTSAESLKERLDGQAVRIEGKAGIGTKLFGAITSQDVADAIKAQLGVDVEKKQIALIDPIKRLGRHEILVDLHRSVDAHVTVEVYDPNAPVEVAVEPEVEVEAAPAEEALETAGV